MKSKRYLPPLVLVLSLFCCVSSRAADDRDTWQQPEKVMDAVGIKPGMTVGEVGAGHGYFTFKLARRVGPSGRIYANDIDPSALRSIEDRAKRENLGNIITLLGEVEKPLFSDATLDMAIMVYVLHDLRKPVELLRNIRPALKPGAPLVILEQDPQKTADSSGHFHQQAKLLEIVAEAGYELVRTETFLSRDNIYVFKMANPTFEPLVRLHDCVQAVFSLEPPNDLRILVDYGESPFLRAWRPYSCSNVFPGVRFPEHWVIIRPTKRCRKEE